MDNDEKLLKLGLTKGVISLVYPETSAALTDLWSEQPHDLYSDAHLDKQESFHKTFFDQWLNWTSSVLNLDDDLKSFCYPTAGSSEAIRDAIARLAAKSASERQQYSIHVFDGDYEGYSAYAKSYNVPVIKHDRENYVKSLAQYTIANGDLFFLSQPSAIDGNIWPYFEQFIGYLDSNYPQLKVMVDLCYVGCVSEEYLINLNSKNIQSIFFSLSKVFGVYYHRIGGVFSREAIPSLYGNMWFKNVFSLKFGENLMKKHSILELPQKYKQLQLDLIQKLDKQLAGFVASDVVLLAHKKKGIKLTDLERYLSRADTVRICLTPKMDKVLNEKHIKISK
jgi:histidinol-phosphate/aromatic aminotransferase/cobyric acid decarboxylase-like protein